MFAAIESCFVARRADTTYFREHVGVDTEEHAAWMAEAVEDVIAVHGRKCVEAILTGMAEAFTETCEVPDMLWRRRCASR
jgi:hypothetical protein